MSGIFSLHGEYVVFACRHGF